MPSSSRLHILSPRRMREQQLLSNPPGTPPPFLGKENLQGFLIDQDERSNGLASLSPVPDIIKDNSSSGLPKPWAEALLEAIIGSPMQEMTQNAGCVISPPLAGMPPSPVPIRPASTCVLVEDPLQYQEISNTTLPGTKLQSVRVMNEPKRSSPVEVLSVLRSLSSASEEAGSSQGGSMERTMARPFCPAARPPLPPSVARKISKLTDLAPSPLELSLLRIGSRCLGTVSGSANRVLRVHGPAPPLVTGASGQDSLEQGPRTLPGAFPPASKQDLRMALRGPCSPEKAHTRVSQLPFSRSASAPPDGLSQRNSPRGQQKRGSEQIYDKRPTKRVLTWEDVLSRGGARARSVE